MAEFEFDIRDIFRIAHRRRWVIILAPLVVGTLTYLTSEVPPLYTKLSRWLRFPE